MLGKEPTLVLQGAAESDDQDYLYDAESEHS